MRWKNAIPLAKLKPEKPKMVNIGLKTLMIVEYGGKYHATEGLWTYEVASRIGWKSERRMHNLPSPPDASPT